MEYPLRGKLTQGERADRKATLLALASLAAVASVLWWWLSPGFERQSAEREFAWSVVLSDERITSRIGAVKDAFIEKERPVYGRRLRNAHHRQERRGIAEGSIRFLVLGARGAANVVIEYRSDHNVGAHSVTDVSVSVIWAVEKPNKAPEPTPESVTPRASDQKSK